MKDRTPSTTTIPSNEYMDAFSSINERPVDDISLEFFYKPHTITLLAVSIASVIYTAFVRYVFNVPYDTLERDVINYISMYIV